jgi:type IV pilus assembly protein PilV
MLIEVLISILLFSMGMLGTVAMQATAMRNNSDAKYRVDASFLANALIGRMWTDDRTPASLQTKYGSTDGSGYTAWLAQVQAQLPGVTANPPTVLVTTVAGSSPPATSKSLVTTTVKWQAPGGAVVHRYVAVTNIK